jgi:hypothetical protein
MFISPSTFLELWPWWSTLRRMLEGELVMVGLILLAALRARDEFDPAKPLGWALLVGFSLVFLVSVIVWISSRAERPGTDRY